MKLFKTDRCNFRGSLELNMKFLVLVSFLLIGIIAGKSMSLPAYHENMVDEMTDDFTSEFWFENEDHDLVRADLEDFEDESETIEETRTDLDHRVFFHLYTQVNPKTPHQLFINDTATLAASTYNVSNPTRFVTHGWINSAESDSCTMIRDAYLKKGAYNVIVIDWSKLSKKPYTFAHKRVKIVGEWVAFMIDFLERQGMDLSETVLIGHSLGAHVAGLAGLQATNQVGYVVGLDPALPLFYFSSSGSRIAKGDAAIVQIIHTNGGILGISSAIGDSDFYPNGGTSQSGCWVDLAGSCSHSRAYKYFAESINSPAGFWGTACGSWRRYRWGGCYGNAIAMMGGSGNLTSATGVYYFKTNSRTAFAKGLKN